MKNISAILTCALALGYGLSAVRGTEPEPQKAGRVLILDNERTWTGDVVRAGDQYCVKRLVGETWIPAERVLAVCATLEDAHRFMQRRANLQDPDERLRLADWCQQHGLLDQAVKEARAATALAPNNARAKHALDYLTNAKTAAAQPRTPPPPEPPARRVDLTAESLGAFASKVQPILMNACVSCHNAGRGGSFQLVRTTGGMSNRRSLEHNLAAVFTEINPANPGASRLLLKAVSIHAGDMTQGPLRNRQAPAYLTLENWVRTTLETNPHLREQAVAAAGPPPVPVAQPAPASAGTFGDERGAPAAEPKPQEAKTPPPQATPAAPQPAAPVTPQPAPAPVAPPAKVSDEPGDPGAFNHEFHPGRKPS